MTNLFTIKRQAKLWQQRVRAKQGVYCHRWSEGDNAGWRDGHQWLGWTA